MPRYRVIEYHSYSLTFDVDADTPEAAKALANAPVPLKKCP